MPGQLEKSLYQLVPVPYKLTIARLMLLPVVGHHLNIRLSVSLVYMIDLQYLLIFWD